MIMDTPLLQADPLLPSMREGFRAVIIGATGGIGGAIHAALAANPHCGDVIGLARTPGGMRHIDLDDDASIANAARQIGEGGTVDLVINATGMLHDESRGISPEKSWKHLDAETMMASYRANCIGRRLLADIFCRCCRVRAKP